MTLEERKERFYNFHGCTATACDDCIYHGGGMLCTDRLTEDARELLEAAENNLVEVVRCEECKWCDTRTNDCHNPRFGNGWANYPPPSVREDFFCCDGERR